MYLEAKETADFLRSKGVGNAKAGIILGTGLNNLADDVRVKVEIDFKQIPHFPEATVAFHSGKLFYGTLEGVNVLLMQGRFHFYEGYSLQQITFPVRVMKLLGIDTLLVSNAGGAVNLDYKPASLMIIDDHINMLPGNPLTGKNHEEFGPRFPDMSRPYDPDLILKMENIARENDINIEKGVYVAWMGPSLETRAEYRFIRLMGADVVGMSTVPEVIVANHMGMKVAAVSVITDVCDPDDLKPINIDSVLNYAALAERNMNILFKELIRQL
jgi:purine-nucleoside phosphorylase